MQNAEFRMPFCFADADQCAAFDKKACFKTGKPTIAAGVFNLII
ncbi:hypothetical protein LRC_01850 [Ligilactobacillus ruminis ATCC 27782]|uniref:Uncharacterized protein n=1 Tax=Ligilactobacillus ruminis (strain ATCC 27782 / RF3) TaxID=1069534 RepID=G2SQG4_LIGR2|nr:hypothetical protein LRC_01850 [Ligilactobacillus ruminis ATCC 27782]